MRLLHQNQIHKDNGVPVGLVQKLKFVDYSLSIDFWFMLVIAYFSFEFMHIYTFLLKLIFATSTSIVLL